jgi:flagellar basal-body rod modification protein FlgD
MSIIPLDASTASSANNANAAAGTAVSKSLNQGDFLKLLVAQLTSQDPLNPQSNTDFAAQMAQFSALQTSQSTQQEILKLNSAQQVQQANDLIGRVVMLQTADGKLAQGTVSGVELSDGIPSLVVNGAWYDLSQVIGITSPPPSAPSAPGGSTKAPGGAPITTR